jgi:hypothetical protein
LWTPEEFGVAGARAFKIGFARAPTNAADVMTREESFIVRGKQLRRELLG